MSQDTTRGRAVRGAVDLHAASAQQVSRPVVAVVDGSRASWNAFEDARCEAARSGGRMVVVFFVQPEWWDCVFVGMMSCGAHLSAETRSDLHLELEMVLAAHGMEGSLAVTHLRDAARIARDVNAGCVYASARLRRRLARHVRHDAVTVVPVL